MRFEQKELFLGLRSPKKRSLLSVNEHFKGERNNKRAFLVNLNKDYEKAPIPR